jgi:hypothetical protein
MRQANIRDAILMRGALLGIFHMSEATFLLAGAVALAVEALLH